MDPGDRMLSQKLLVDVGVVPFAAETNMCSLNPQDMPLILLGLLLSALLLQGQVHIVI
jgi:hypothetical protein